MINPKISVLMTIYNHEKFVKSSIDSIVNQNYKNWELIAIDNGSTDKSKNIIKKIKNKKIRKFFLKKNIGRTNCLNYGLKYCKGKYIAILDSDDIAKKNRLKFQLNTLEKDKNIFLVASNYDLIDQNNKVISNKNFFYQKNLRSLLFYNYIAHSTVMYKKTIIKKIGKYPVKFKYAQDYAFYLKIFKNHNIKFLKERLIKLRKTHTESETFRVIKKKHFYDEQLNLLKWSYENLNPNFQEKLQIFLKYFKLIIKKFIL